MTSTRAISDRPKNPFPGSCAGYFVPNSHASIGLALIARNNGFKAAGFHVSQFQRAETMSADETNWGQALWLNTASYKSVARRKMYNGRLAAARNHRGNALN